MAIRKKLNTQKKRKAEALPLTFLGNPILRKKAKKVTHILSPQTKKIAEGMIAACQKNGGVGIAAPQVNSDLRMFVMWERPTKRRPDLPTFGPEVVINPEIVSMSKQIKRAYEGCLSIPGIFGNVPRAVHIGVTYTNRAGEKVSAKFSHFLARVFQHEFDHLEGIVFLDRITSKDVITEKEYMRLVAEKMKEKKHKKIKK